MLTPSSQLPVEEADKLLHTEQWVETTVNSLTSPSSRKNSNITDTKRRKKDQRRKSGISATYVVTNDYAPFQDGGSKPDLSDRPRKQSLTLPAINYSRTSLNLLREPDDLRFSKASMINITGSDEYSEDEHHEDIDKDDDKANDKDDDGDDDREEKSRSGYNDNINGSWRDKDGADVGKKKNRKKKKKKNTHQKDDKNDYRKDSINTLTSDNANNTNDAKSGAVDTKEAAATGATSAMAEIDKKTPQNAATTTTTITNTFTGRPDSLTVQKIPEIRTTSEDVLTDCSIMSLPVPPPPVHTEEVVERTQEDKEQSSRRKRLVRENAKDIEDENIPHLINPKDREEDVYKQPLPPTSGRKSANSINYNNPTVKFYNRVCKKLGVLPLRKVIAQFGRSHLSFRNLTLTTKDMKAVCLALQKEQHALSFDFTGNFMCVKELDYLLTVLNHLHTVFQVSLCNNCLSGQAVRDISNFLLTNDFITRLDISGNKLNDNDAVPITEILKKNVTIKTLVLNHNEFREEGGMLLGEAIAANNTLEDLDLSWNHLRRCGAVGIAKGLQANTALRTVNLAWNGFGFEGCVAIGDMLCNNFTITELNLAYNRINPPALLELLRGVAGNRTLRILKIGYNPVTAAFSSLILAVVKKHRESGLENIDMAGVVVDKEFVALLEEIQKDRFFIVNYDVSLPVKKMSREEMREKIGLPSAYNVDPLRMLYLLKEKMRASDFFYKINKDHDDGLQRDELYSLFDEAGIPVTGSVVDKIMEFMDTNGDGTIDLSEFLQGDKRIKNMSRKKIKGDQERKAKDTSYTKYSRTFQKAHIDPITNALKVDASTTPMRQSRRPSVVKTLQEGDTEDSNHLKIP